MSINELELIDDDEILESEIDFSGEYINTITKEQLRQVLEEYFEENDVAPKPVKEDVTLYGNKWVGENRKFTQVINVKNVTETSQVDLTPSEEILNVFYDKKVLLSTKNVDGIVTVTLIGEKLEDDYTMQVTITEVDYE
jgi:hypothetical protein